MQFCFVFILCLTNEILTDEAGWSSESNEQLRLMVLGGDDALLDEACGSILGERQNRDAFKFGNMVPRKAQVCGRQVSVLKTPSYWLEHLKSYLFFSNRVKSLKNDLQSFESLLFPGPHAFLLVHRDVKNSGREYYLLRALSEVFGKEVLDYCMVLFMDRARHHNPIKNTCLKMCGGRYHILQNTDKSVQQLFKKTEAMTQWKNSGFFTNHLECFIKAEIYFKAEYEKKENQLKVANEKLQDNEKQLENKRTENTVKEASLHEKQRCLDEREKQLEIRERCLDDRERCLDDREKKLDDRERCLDERERCLDDREKKLDDRERCLDERERCLDDREKKLDDRERCLDEREKKLDDRERCLDERERCLDDRERCLHEKQRCLDERVKELDDRERCLDEREKKLEIREREVTQRDARSRELHQTTADTASEYLHL